MRAGQEVSHRHGTVWLDHYRAVVIVFEVDHAEVISLENQQSVRQLHRKSGPPGSGRAIEGATLL